MFEFFDLFLHDASYFEGTLLVLGGIILGLTVVYYIIKD